MILEKETYEKIGKTWEQASQKSKIICLCDYCGLQFERLKHNLQRSHQYLKKDSCSRKECVQKKREEVNILNFGTINAFQNEEVKKKIVETNIKKYGVDNPTKNSKIKEKQQKTCEELYGCKNPFASDVVKAKIKQKVEDLFGVPNAFKNKEIQVKQRETLNNRHGKPYALQIAEFRKKAMDTCIKNHGCFPANNYGKVQAEIKEWLNSFGFDFNSSRKLIVGKEIDLYDEGKDLAIEYCGLHWHHEFSLEPRLMHYHYDKYIGCLSNGVQLLTIFSDEWEGREKQCKGHIKSIIGVCERKLFARKCVVKEIVSSSANSFIEENHIQGRNKLGVVFFGIFFQEELVGVMSFGRHNRQCDNLVLDRLCFKDGVQVLGGASRLLSYCIDWAKGKDCNKVISFSDNRWSVGKIYETMGFELEHEYGPDYSYVNIKRPNERISKQSQKKKTTNCPEGMTEYQWAHSRGLARIWDCGKKRWVKKL